MAQQIPMDPSDIAGTAQDDGTIEVAPDLAYLRLAFVNVVFSGAPGTRDWVLIDAGIFGMAGRIRRAAAGDSPFSRDVLKRLVNRATSAGSAPRRPVPGLTARERDVLELVGEGLSNVEIAERLHIGITTVKTHITALMTKTSSPNRVRLALLAHKS